VLMGELRIPAVFRCGVRLNLPGDEALLIFLKILSYPTRYEDVVDFFGRCRGYLSHVFNSIVNHIYDTFHHIIDGSNDFTHLRHKLASWSKCVSEKALFLVGLGWTHFMYSNVPFFVDGTHNECCRPGVPPGESGGQRWQESIYTGHHKAHAFNYHGASSPDGIIRDLPGPYVGNENDLIQLEMCGFEDCLRQSCPVLSRKAFTRKQTFFLLLLFRGHRSCFVDGVQYKAAGDLAYVKSDVMVCPYKKKILSRLEKIHNDIFKKIRISVEWPYGWVTSVWAYVDFKKQMVLGQRPIGRYYVVACIMTNVRSCLYGNQASSYFECPRPSLNDYLNMRG
jgi:hypothetical protein